MMRRIILVLAVFGFTSAGEAQASGNRGGRVATQRVTRVSAKKIANKPAAKRVLRADNKKLTATISSPRASLVASARARIGGYNWNVGKREWIWKGPAKPQFLGRKAPQGLATMKRVKLGDVTQLYLARDSASGTLYFNPSTGHGILAVDSSKSAPGTTYRSPRQYFKFPLTAKERALFE